MPIHDSKQNKNINKVTSPPALGSPVIQEIYPQELILEIPKPKESFIKKHKRAIMAISAAVLATAVLGVVAFFAWPAVASAVLGFGVYGLTLGALAGANLIAQVGLVAAVFAVGGFIAGGGLFTAGSNIINSIIKAWEPIYKSPGNPQANPIPQPDLSSQSLKSIAETLSQHKGDIKNPSPLSSVAPATDSGDFLAQVQQKKEKIKRWSEMNKQLINDHSLSDNEYKELEVQANKLGEDILSNRLNQVSQNNQESNQQTEEQHSSGLSNKFKEEYRRTIFPHDSSTIEARSGLEAN